MANLASLGRDRYCSQAGIAALLKEIEKHGLPDKISRSALKRARDEDLKQCSNIYGDLIVQTELDMLDDKGKPAVKQSFPFINPLCFLQNILTNCEPFKDYFAAHLLTHGKSIESPLRIAVYADEVNPGNQLRHDQTRKCQIIYWAFLDGPGIGVDQLWFTLGLARSHQVSKIRGGMSQYVRGALQHFVQPHDMRLGVQLTLDGAPHFRFLNFSMFIGDEGALKDMFGFKGASGVHVCPLCHAIVSEASDLHRFSDMFKSSTCLNVSEWRLATNESIRDHIRFLHRNHGLVSKKDFEEMTKSSGWNYIPDGLLGTGEIHELNICVASQLQYDWMHCFVVNGAFNVEVGALLPSLKAAGLNQTMLHEFLQKHTWPSQIGGKAASGANVFKKKHEGNLKCSASEALGVYNVIRVFLGKHIAQLQPYRVQVQSYFKLCDALDCIQGCRKGTHNATDLQSALTNFVVAHQEAYDSTVWLPKHRYLQHLALQLTSHGKIVGCFVHERKHRVAKRYAENVRKVDGTFDLSVLKDVLASNLRDLKDREILPLGIRNAREAPMSLKQALVSLLNVLPENIKYGKEAHYALGLSASVGDYLLFQSGNRPTVGLVEAFFQSGEQIFALLQIWTSGASSNIFMASAQRALVEKHYIEEVLCYQKIDESNIEIVPTSLFARAR